MGCDIHCHVEVRIKGKWEHYSVVQVDRSYRLFSKMAGVRASVGSPEPICQPRGLPDDVSTVTKLDSDKCGTGAHTDGWLTAAEAGEIQRWLETERKKDGDGVRRPRSPLFGYVFGDYVDSHIRFPDDYKRILNLGFEDVRVVFWFDN